MLRSFLALLFVAALTVSSRSQQTSFNPGWEFVKDIDTAFSAKLLVKKNDIAWEKISLPHTASIEPIQKAGQQWQGICFYRKFFTVPLANKGKHVAIQFDAAMQDATVYFNGQQVLRHLGGYLPFYVDITGLVKAGAENSILVRLDNRDNVIIPPGKPIKTLDFNYYSGIYRNAWMIVKNKLRFTNAVDAKKTAGGGVFVHYENISDRSATLIAKADVRNDLAIAQPARVRLTLKDKAGATVATALSGVRTVSPGSSAEIVQQLQLSNPKLWSPDRPYLYRLTVELLKDGAGIDRELIATGIKKTRIEGGALFINDKKIKIRGTNRHQDYPWIGNAVPDNAQYRDAYKIKMAGFNFVRTSHYPQSPAFLSACDELGIMVMDAIPGWQFVGNAAFQENSFQDTRDMIHRDRNHPSIILWEASLNESNMKKEYMDKAHSIVHEELPFEGIYSAGWKNSVYDVFLPARQHGKAPDYWKKYNQPMPLLIAEYGDWEYYAQNAGFNQTEYKDLKAEERTSRQLRGFGEKRLLQQALNYQEAHNDNLYGADLGDANWLMFDYNRGYADDIESSGIMDITRVPKFSYYFYRSQLDASGVAPFNQPVLFIANYWQKDSDPAVRIYSNCDEVELLLDGKSLGRQKPDKDQFSTNLKHPPFTFHTAGGGKGTLTAVGYIAGKQAARSVQSAAGPASKIVLKADRSGKDLQSGAGDVLFVYADITDANGNIVYTATQTIDFKLTGDATLVGQLPGKAEAGTAAILVRAGSKPGQVVVRADAQGLAGGELLLSIK